MFEFRTFFTLSSVAILLITTHPGYCLEQTFDVNFLRDVSAATGIDFRHSSGKFLEYDGTNSRYMPETIGAGVTLFDVDNDMDIDILFVNSSGFNGVEQSNGGAPALYRNDGNWRFTDITNDSGLNKKFYGMGATTADYDGDGDQDILFTTLNGVRLFQNRQGIFEDITLSAGLATKSWVDQRGVQCTEWSTGAVFFDADGDLDLDLVSIQYVRWSINSNIITTYDGIHRGYTSPRSYQGESLRIWLQNNGRFFDTSALSGLELEGKSLGIALWDFDKDGRLDIAVANDTTENFLFHNRGNGKFNNVSYTAGMAFDRSGNTRAGMGIDIADYNNNGHAAVAIGNFTGEPISFFYQQDTWKFSEESISTQISSPTLPLLTFGLIFADIDLDGWLDIVTTNGHVEPNIAEAYKNERYLQPMQWLRNQGNGKFKDVGQNISALKKPMVGRGLASADLDGDGDLDLVASSNSGTPRIIKNNSINRNYLRILLKGRFPNTDAIGARVILKNRKTTQQRTVGSGGSFLSQSEKILTFGLGGKKTVESVTIEWPDGTSETLINPALNKILKITQRDNFDIF